MTVLTEAAFYDRRNSSAVTAIITSLKDMTGPLLAGRFGKPTILNT
jgi:hypothetical protein